MLICLIIAGDVFYSHFTLHTDDYFDDSRCHFTWCMGGDQILRDTRLQQVVGYTGRIVNLNEVIICSNHR